MQITNKKISNLKEYENNPRDNTQAVDAVANSIREFGFKVPIIVDNQNIIIAGHTRYKAAISLGLAEDVHHKITLTQQNVYEFDVSLDLGNLECLCRRCHNKETHGKKNDYAYDSNGDLIEI